MKNSKKQKASDIWQENIDFYFQWDYRLEDGTDSTNDLRYRDFILRNYSYSPELHGFTTKNDKEKT